MTTATPPDHPALRHAWRRYGAFDVAAGRNERRFLRLRRLILIVGVLAAAAGIVAAAGSAELHATMRWVTFVASLVLTGLFAFATRVDRGTLWVQSRRSAELILHETFLYRTGSGPYRAAGDDVSKRDALLVAQLSALNTAQPAKPGGIPDDQLAPRPARDAGGAPLTLAAGTADDGLCPLTADDYVAVRLEPQRTWYQRRAQRVQRMLLTYQIAGIAIGLVGSTLAFAGGALTAWVAITTASAAAITGWTELRRLEPTAAAYELAASQLEDVLLWWSALAADARNPDAFDKLVTQCEGVIESENASWTQDMRKRIADLKAATAATATPTRPPAST
ncbi:MAG TPA: DUF4231 domain-containing protein [Kofleriaceae bacterium]|nr:DUF4231 domain-containing protein [Kofleriaceae bacterium]